MSGHPTNLRVKLPLLCALLQLATVLLFAFFVQYDSHTSPRLWHEDVQLHSKGPLDHEFYPRYPSTLFLWVFWPSFNSAVTAHGDDQQRTVMNTYFSLASSTLATFAISALVNHGGQLDMVHIQNAALAGGVIVGTSAEMVLTPFGALIAGCVAGLVATLGFRFLTPILAARLKIQDTCGIHNLHGMPGLLGALLGALVAALATPDAYGEGMADVFPLVAAGHRTPIRQSLFQLLGLLVSLGMATVGGSLVGAILKMRSLAMPPDALCFEDQIYWEVFEGFLRVKPAAL
ncbi:PREDICTED: ammonium transporter Rh type B-A-like isoform X2 [Thamnophis sirtalis]|uniref:Ammonium transporter Rh type B-A-like isoform X2 n=1 Tax=Thamnophis sirtalis TaxID=35019 RepID=A0A6I9YTJ9_9SAUR|nr:PREDICTED: ammonium transporter Rh type B-A-like isoform X2 [Thamnophis sirtalis]